MTNILMRNKANSQTSTIPQIRNERSVFPMGKNRKQTMQAGYLVPIMCEEILPGDTWEINMQAFIRLATQITAPMDNLMVKTYFFFDPYRLSWKNFTKQHGERENPDDTIDYITPAIEAPNGFEYKSLFDYLGGIRCGVPNSKITALAARSYNRIWNRYFRAEHLQDSVYENNGDNDDDISNFKLLKKAKMHDYFTDCLPNLQLGEQVMLPIGTSAPIYGSNSFASGNIEYNLQNYNAEPFRMLSNYTQANTAEVLINSANTQIFPGGTNYISGFKFNSSDPIGYADLSSALSASISAVRLAIDTQEILERDNRNGVRYTEQLEGRYGVLNPDLRLDRPQYLGGTATPLFTTPVIQTSGSGTNGQITPQGNIAGFGSTYEHGNIIKQSFGEFGIILGLMCIQAVPQYQQGMHKKHQRWERYDYYYPEFNGLSDQAVTNGEIYYQGESVTNTTTGETIDSEAFGYIPRYDEYRFFNNEICGELRSEYPETLDSWHYAEKFENLPNLSGEFIEDKTEEIIKRTLAVQTEDENGEEINAEQFICDIQFSGAVTRVLPSKGIPQTGGRIL